MSEINHKPATNRSSIAYQPPIIQHRPTLMWTDCRPSHHSPCVSIPSNAQFNSACPSYGGKPRLTAPPPLSATLVPSCPTDDTSAYHMAALPPLSAALVPFCLTDDTSAFHMTALHLLSATLVPFCPTDDASASLTHGCVWWIKSLCWGNSIKRYSSFWGLISFRTNHQSSKLEERACLLSNYNLMDIQFCTLNYL